MLFLETVLQSSCVGDNAEQRALICFYLQSVVLLDLSVCASLLRHTIKQLVALAVITLNCKPEEEVRM